MLSGKVMRRVFEVLPKSRIKLRKPKLVENGYGSEVQFVEITIEGIFLPAMSDRLLYRKEGQLPEGSLRILVKPEYVIAGITYTVETGDKIEYGKYVGEILSIQDYIFPDTGVVLKECFLE